jgi:hypothetical protein
MSRASMPRPSNATLLSRESEVQRPAGISLEGVHNELRCHIRVDHRVYMIGAHVRREQSPIFVSANFTDRSEYDIALIGIQLKW